MKWKYSVCILLILIGLFSCGEDKETPIIDLIIPEITKAPYLGDVTKTSIVISVTLKNLAPSTLYHYRVVSDSSSSGDNTFHTAVEPFEPFTLVAYGDTRTNIHDHRSVVNRIIEHSPNLILDTGDLVTDGRIFLLWDAFFLVIKNLARNAPYYTVLGNHESNAQHYYNLFHLPKGGGKEGEQWYSFDYGNVHFVCMDSNVRHSQEQLVLQRDFTPTMKAQRVTSNFTFHVLRFTPYISTKHLPSQPSALNKVSL